MRDGTRDILGSLEFAGLKDRKPLEAALRPIYTAVNAEAAEAALAAFEAGGWGKRYPTVTATWRRAWDRVIPFFGFAPGVRRVIYTTNAIESVHARLRKIIKSRAAREWKAAMNQFAIAYGDRFTRPALDHGLQRLAHRVGRSSQGDDRRSGQVFPPHIHNFG